VASNIRDVAAIIEHSVNDHWQRHGASDTGQGVSCEISQVGGLMRNGAGSAALKFQYATAGGARWEAENTRIPINAHLKSVA
jgi:hypothetical protein